jgi:hypothetical protein
MDVIVLNKSPDFRSLAWDSVGCQGLGPLMGLGRPAVPWQVAGWGQRFDLEGLLHFRRRAMET